MKEAFEKIIEKLEEISEPIRPVGWSRKIKVVDTKAAIEIVNQVAVINTNTVWILNPFGSICQESPSE